MTADGAASLLLAPTPPGWFDLATERWHDLLLDHANCEKKAASTALALMFSYPEDFELARHMSRLAREELRHFEQVQDRIRRFGVPFRRMSPSRYAEGLRKAVSREEPRRQVDLLLCGALIEARSHERFVGLIPRLPQPLADFYESLAAAESRHAGLYLDLALRHDPAVAKARLALLASVEAGLVTAPDPDFRFHSGAPQAA